MSSLERFCRRPPITIGQDETVWKAAEKMREHHVGTVVVLDGTAIVGILTDRDIMTRVILPRRDPDATAVQAVMSRDVATVRSSERIDAAVRRMREGGVRRLPIVGPAGNLEGFVAFDDLAVLLATELGEAISAIRSNRGP